MNERELYEAILEKHPSLIKEIRNKTIDELIHELKHRETTIYETGFMCHEYSDDELDEIAEQIKGGAE